MASVCTNEDFYQNEKEKHKKIFEKKIWNLNEIFIHWLKISLSSKI